MAPLQFSTRKSSNNNRRLTPRRKPIQPVLGSRDLSTQRVGGPDAPPQHVANPPVDKIVRMTYTYNGSAIDQNISAPNIFTQDDTDYGSSCLRYQRLRITKAQVWMSLDAPPTAGPIPALTVTDPKSTVYYTDTPSMGVDWAHVAMRFCLSHRETMYGNADTMSVMTNIKVAAAEGARGTIKVDLSVTFF